MLTWVNVPVSVAGLPSLLVQTEMAPSVGGDVADDGGGVLRVDIAVVVAERHRDGVPGGRQVIVGVGVLFAEG